MTRNQKKMCVYVIVKILFVEWEKEEHTHIQQNPLDSGLRKSYISESLETMGNLQYSFTRYHIHYVFVNQIK